jgi:transformation/transcription domain-associated protein
VRCWCFAVAGGEANGFAATDARFLFRNLLFGFKTIATTLTRLHGSGPDAEMMCRFFESAVKCMVLFDSSRDQGREQKEVMEVFSTTLVQTELIIFQEVIEHRMEFFFSELIRVRSCSAD